MGTLIKTQINHIWLGISETLSHLAKLVHIGTCVLLHLLTHFFFFKAACEKKEESVGRREAKKKAVGRTGIVRCGEKEAGWTAEECQTCE